VRAVVLRWGFLLAGLLLALALLGGVAQERRRAIRELRTEHAALTARVAELEAALAGARRAGFVPLAEGRWAR